MDLYNPDNNVRYVVDPEESIKLLDPGSKISYKQANIFCNECNSFQALSVRNGIHAAPPFNAKRSVYYGMCFTDQCIQNNKEKTRQKRVDELFFAQEKYLKARCDTADARCEATSIKYSVRPGNLEDANNRILGMELLEDIAFDEWKNIKYRPY